MHHILYKYNILHIFGDLRFAMTFWKNKLPLHCHIAHFTNFAPFCLQSSTLILKIGPTAEALLAFLLVLLTALWGFSLSWKCVLLKSKTLMAPFAYFLYLVSFFTNLWLIPDGLPLMQRRISVLVFFLTSRGGAVATAALLAIFHGLLFSHACMCSSSFDI